MGVKCFLVVESERASVSYRVHAHEHGCGANPDGCHQAESHFGVTIPLGAKPDFDAVVGEYPTACACGYVFTETDERTSSTRRHWVRADGEPGEWRRLSDAPPGAMWDAHWYYDGIKDSPYVGPDGRSLVVKLPNGNDWHIDGSASNCDMPCKTCGVARNQHPPFNGSNCRYDEARPHKCWTRTGEPPLITVGKSYGPTCGAGAGSISSGEGANNYHGFLRGGVFEP